MTSTPWFTGVVLMTPAADRWVIRLLQAVPQF